VSRKLIDADISKDLGAFVFLVRQKIKAQFFESSVTACPKTLRNFSEDFNFSSTVVMNLMATFPFCFQSDGVVCVYINVLRRHYACRDRFTNIHFLEDYRARSKQSFILKKI
jgi:hypothetical protein